jgi:hypothetical protein
MTDPTYRHLHAVPNLPEPSDNDARVTGHGRVCAREAVPEIPAVSAGPEGLEGPARDWSGRYTRTPTVQSVAALFAVPEDMPEHLVPVMPKDEYDTGWQDNRFRPCSDPREDDRTWLPDVVEDPVERAGFEDDARRACEDCPVRRECLGWAIGTRQDYGMWGGFTGPERLTIAKTLNLTPLLQHGTLAAYMRHKCRCAECRTVWNAYKTEKQRERRYREQNAGGRGEGAA